MCILKTNVVEILRQPDSSDSGMVVDGREKLPQLDVRRQIGSTYLEAAWGFNIPDYSCSNQRSVPRVVFAVEGKSESGRVSGVCALPLPVALSN